MQALNHLFLLKFLILERKKKNATVELQKKFFQAVQQVCWNRGVVSVVVQSLFQDSKTSCISMHAVKKKQSSITDSFKNKKKEQRLTPWQPDARGLVLCTAAISGSWWVGGILNSVMPGGCGCERMSFPVLSEDKRHGYISVSLSSSHLLRFPVWQVLLQRNLWSECNNKKPKNKQAERLSAEALASMLCSSVFPLLINSSLSHWSF